jgi:hypothetical protein
MSMNYHKRVREIMSGFVMGHLDRETCITQFEDLMHEYGLLPKDEQIDRTISNENFLGLLKMAKDQKDPRSNRDPEASKDMRHAPAMDAIHNLLTPDVPGADQHYRIAQSVQQRCPVCQKPCEGVYNRMQTLDHQVVPVDPPRCKTCMLKWIEDTFGTGPHSNVAKAPELSFTPDITAATPLRPDEMDFFQQYEQEMEDFKP